ncbi:hypothetical protein V500_00585 [Pseudogymnoascus sp. VKM F-4518 (FW-2643)]|nr:hypothetical protein V500_00585 [Pseudogymnoascus sp. VKM F-4518 (FW-2643)]
MDTNEELQADVKPYAGPKREASDLVWRHQNPESVPALNAPHRYCDHMRYQHVRAQSVGPYTGPDAVPVLGFSTGSVLGSSNISSARPHLQRLLHQFRRPPSPATQLTRFLPLAPLRSPESRPLKHHQVVSLANARIPWNSSTRQERNTHFQQFIQRRDVMRVNDSVLRWMQGAVTILIQPEIIVDRAIKPLVYCFVPSAIAIYKWAQGGHINEIDFSTYAAFMAELLSVLADASLTDVIGMLVRQPGNGGMKGIGFASACANITLHKDQPAEGDNSVEVSWVFEERTIAPGDGTSDSLPHSNIINSIASTLAMSACSSKCQDFVGNHSFRYKENRVR